MFGRGGAGGEKASGSKVQKRVEGKGRKKERGVGKTEIRKTGGGEKAGKKGEGKKECGVTPKDGEKRKTVERGRKAGTAGRRRTGNET